MARGERKRRIQEAAADIKRIVAIRLAEKYSEDPERFSKLVEAGLVDEATLKRLPHDLDFDSAVRQFRDRLAAIATTEPSVLARLDVRPLEVLCVTEAPSEDSSEDPLAVVFSDLEGFTSYTSTNGDLEASAMLRDHYETVDSIVRGRGGAVVKKIGDGHMLRFTEPRAAVLAGVELADVLAGPLRVRVGGHKGEVVKIPDDLFGHVVNVASRVTDIARGGESLITTSLRDGAGSLPGIEFDEPMSTNLRGIEDPFDVCRAHHR